MDTGKVHRGLEYDLDAVGDRQVLELNFRWFPLAELSTLDVRPKCLQEVLANLSETTQHIVNFG